MIRAVVLLVALGVAGCGVDGPPVAPSDPPAPEPGVTVSGEARIGVVSGG